MSASSRPLFKSFLITTAAAVAALVAAAAGARSLLPLTDLYPVKTAAVFLIVVLVKAATIDAHHPFDRLGLANQVTTFRAMLVAMLAGLVGEPGAPILAASAAGLTILVAVLDGVDGFLARRGGMASRFGARFDMEIDALLIMVLSVLVWHYGKAGAWVWLSGLLRYAFVAAGWAFPWLARPLGPSRRRQAICVVQVGGLNLAIVPAIAPSVSAPLAGVALAALVYSFVVDIAWLWHQPPGPSIRSTPGPR